jgi:hemerythrin-like metal-binding protein
MDWKEELSVGIAQQDKEHQDIVQCVNDVGTAASTEAVRAAMDRLIFCIRIHFKTEESMMRELNYPHFAEHIKEHQHLLDEVKAIESDIQDAPVSPCALDLLRKAMESHFMADEKDYGVFFLSRSKKH